MTRPSVTGARPRCLISEPYVRVPPMVAAFLDRHLPLMDLRIRARGLDSDIDDVLIGLRVAAVSYRETRRAEILAATSGPTSEPLAAKPEVGRRWYSTRDVADALDRTDRAVRLAASEGRLHGEKDAEGRWHFSTDHVAAFVATRTRK